MSAAYDPDEMNVDHGDRCERCGRKCGSDLCGECDRATAEQEEEAAR